MKKQQGVPQDEAKKTLIQKLQHPYSLLRSLMKKQKGFTLIELMVVMAIIAILATAGLSAYTGYIRRAQDSAALQIAYEMNTLRIASQKPNGDDLSPSDFAAFVAAEGIMAKYDPQTQTLAFSAETLKNLLGVPTAFAQTLVPKPFYNNTNCLNESYESGYPCALKLIGITGTAGGQYLIIVSPLRTKEALISNNPRKSTSGDAATVGATFSDYKPLMVPNNGGGTLTYSIEEVASNPAVYAPSSGVTTGGIVSSIYVIGTLNAGGENNSDGGGDPSYSGGCYNSGYDEYGTYLTNSCRGDLTSNPPNSGGPSET